MSRPLPANLEDQLERIRHREERSARRADEEWQSEFAAAASLSESDLSTSQPLNWAFEEPRPGEEHQTPWQKKCNRAYEIGFKIMLWVMVIFVLLSVLSSLLK